MYCSSKGYDCSRFSRLRHWTPAAPTKNNALDGPQSMKCTGNAGALIRLEYYRVVILLEDRPKGDNARIWGRMCDCTRQSNEGPPDTRISKALRATINSLNGSWGSPTVLSNQGMRSRLSYLGVASCCRAEECSHEFALLQIHCTNCLPANNTGLSLSFLFLITQLSRESQLLSEMYSNRCG